MQFNQEYVGRSRTRVAEHDRRRRQVSVRQGQELPSIEGLGLGDASRMFVAVLFFDLAGFSKLTEEIPLGSTLRLLDLLLVEATQIVKDGGGVVDKFTGDGFLAVFGGGSEQQTVKQAVEVAISASWVVDRVLNPYFGQVQLPAVQYKMGLDAGTVMIARLGIRGTNELTLMGPTVNLASKITEAATPGQIRVGADIHQRLGGDTQYCQPLGKVPGFNYEHFLYTGRWKL